MGLHCQCNVYPMFIQCNVYALKIQKSGRTTIVDQVIRERSEFDECSGFSPAAADRLLTVLLMALSLWLWQLVPKIWTNFFLLQLLTTFGTRRRFLKRFASVVRYQCIFYPSSTAHQLMVVQSITILKVFRWLTTGVRRTLCFFSWCHHFLATTPPAYVGNSPAIAPLTRTMIISCRLTQMVFWEGWQQRWEDFFDRSRRWKKRGKRRVMWRLLDPLRDCRDFSGFLLFGGCSVENLRFNPGGKLRLIGSN